MMGSESWGLSAFLASLCVAVSFGAVQSAHTAQPFLGLHGLGPQPAVSIGSRRFTHNFHHISDDREIRFAYDVIHAPKVFSLDVMAVANVTCDGSRIEIRLASGANVTDFNAALRVGHKITGGHHWRCLEEGAPAPFYREITAVSKMYAAAVVLYTRKISLLDCFDRLHVRLYHKPHANGSRIADDSDKRKRLFPIDATWQHTWNIFDYNWDPDHQRVITPTMPIMRKGGRSSRGGYNVEVDCNGCYAYMEAGIDFEMTFNRDWFSLPYLQFFKLLVHGELKVNVDVSATAHLAFSSQSEVQFGPSITIPGLPFYLGPFAAAITPSLQLLGEASLQAYASGLASSGFDFSVTLPPTGVRYSSDDQTWHDVSPGLQTSFNAHPVHISASGSATLTVALVPQLTLTLVHMLPISFGLLPSLQAQVEIERGASLRKQCDSTSTRDSACYQLSSGIAFQFTVGELTIDLRDLGFGEYHFGQSLGLPYTYTTYLTPMRPLSCSLCRGCTAADDSSEPCYFWQIPDRAIPCQSGFSGTGPQLSAFCSSSVAVLPQEVLDDDLCNTLVKPALSEYCTPAEAADADEAVDQCTVSTDCGDCLSDWACGWCDPNGGITGSCLLGSYNQSADGSCAGSAWNFLSCPADNQIVITSINQGDLFSAETTYKVTWNGGPPNGDVILRLLVYPDSNSSKLFAGFGIPWDSKPNVNVWDWLVFPGLGWPGLGWQLIIADANDLSNYDVSPEFFLDPTCNRLCGYVNYIATVFGNCSMDCGGGTNDLEAICALGTGEEVALQDCFPDGWPYDPPVCNTFPCPDRPLAITLPGQGALGIGGNEFQITWTGGQEYGYVCFQWRANQNEGFVDGSHIGLPGPYPNTGSITWTLPRNVNVSGTFQFQVSSGWDCVPGNNTAQSAPFAMTHQTTWSFTIQTNKYGNSGGMSGSIEIAIVGTLDTVYLNLTMAAYLPGQVITTGDLQFGNVGVISQIEVLLIGPDNAEWNVDWIEVDMASQQTYYGVGQTIGENFIGRQDCTQFTDCSTCDAAVGCGWCGWDGGGGCLPGTIDRPYLLFDQDVSCWTWNATCAPPPTFTFGGPIATGNDATGVVTGWSSSSGTASPVSTGSTGVAASWTTGEVATSTGNRQRGTSSAQSLTSTRPASSSLSGGAATWSTTGWNMSLPNLTTSGEVPEGETGTDEPSFWYNVKVGGIGAGVGAGLVLVIGIIVACACRCRQSKPYRRLSMSDDD